MKVILVLAVSFVVAWAVTQILIPLLQDRRILDFPNSRSSHDVPTPTCGGAGIIAGLMAGLLTASLLGLHIPTVGLLLGGALMALIGFMDDRFGGLSVRIRLTLQLAAAGLVVFYCGGIDRLPLPKPLAFDTGQLAIPLAFFWIVAVTNIYNFLDGIDGFAGLQGAVAGLAIAFLGQGNTLGTLGLAIAGACGGFLIYNWHPAKIFMGDIGSGTLGFLLAAVPFQLGPESRADAIYIVSMSLWFFLSDGSFTIVRRLWHGEKIWQAHRSHLYQQLVTVGLRHDQVTIRVIGCSVILAALALVSVNVDRSISRWVVIFIGLAGFIAYYSWTRHLKRTDKEAGGLTATPLKVEPGKAAWSRVSASSE